jgi:hypothetical protein
VWFIYLVVCSLIEKKHIKLQETQQHIFDKKAHGRNIKKGDPKYYEAICPTQ